MSAYVVVECDAEDCERVSDQGGPDIATARRWAKQDGWERVGSDDYCSAHVAIAAARRRESRSTGLIAGAKP